MIHIPHQLNSRVVFHLTEHRVQLGVFAGIRDLEQNGTCVGEHDLYFLVRQTHRKSIVGQERVTTAVHCHLAEYLK